MSNYLSDIRQGNTRTIKIDYGKTINITGWVFYLTLKKDIDDTENACQVSNTAGDNPYDDALNGLIHLTLPSDVSATLEPDSYNWSIQVDKGGTPPVIITLLPPVEEWNDKIKVVKALRM